ncbi:MAG: hypothetical protein SGPRY_012296 [Prymnesium sp.]
MEIYQERKIILLKAERDTSHVNQAYDQSVAKNDKNSMGHQHLEYRRQSGKQRKRVIDGWELMHVALAAVRELAPSSWVTSFRSVNLLHPQPRVPFQESCVRISQFLHGGDSFRPEAAELDTFAMCHRKRYMVEIFDSHADFFSVEGVKQLHADMHIPFADMHNLLVCIELA